MEFKVGDRVRYIGKDERYLDLLGEIVSIWKSKFDNEIFLDVDTKEEFPYTFPENEVELCNKEKIQRPKQKKTTLEELEQRIENLEKEVFKPIVIHDRPKEKSLLTEDERVILRNLDKRYKWIVRDSDNNLYACINEPFKMHNMFWDCEGGFENLGLFNHLFEFIKFEYEEQKPYNIEELLKGESGNEN